MAKNAESEICPCSVIHKLCLTSMSAERMLNITCSDEHESKVKEVK